MPISSSAVWYYLTEHHHIVFQLIVNRCFINLLATYIWIVNHLIHDLGSTLYLAIHRCVEECKLTTYKCVVHLLSWTGPYP
jgi:hypothetical protein